VSKAFTREDDIPVPEITRPAAAPSVVHLTAQGAERLRQELQDLQHQRAELSRAAETDPAVRELDLRIREIQQMLASATVVQTAGEPDVVRFGSEVTVRSDNDGEESRYRIVGPAEIDIERGCISSVSPLAKALLNRKVGERVRFKYPAGEDTLEIITVRS